MKSNNGFLLVVGTLLLLFLGYHSVYFRRLSAMQDSQPTSVDFTNRADSLYQNILQHNQPMSLDRLLAEIKQDPTSAINTHGNRLGIGNSAYFMVSCTGAILAKTEEGLHLNPIAGIPVFIDTKFIFGNAIRDASGLVKLTDYKTNADFNKLSEALNTIIRDKTLPVALNSLRTGDTVQVRGAIKLNKSSHPLSAYNLLPVSIIKK